MSCPLWCLHPDCLESTDHFANYNSLQLHTKLWHSPAEPPNDLQLCVGSTQRLQDQLRSHTISVPWRGGSEKATIAFDHLAVESSVSLLTGSPAIGLDSEWDWERQVAVLQLAGPGGCLVCMLPDVDLGQCPTLLQMLSDPTVVKAGIGIAQDAALLRQRGVEVAGCLDLFLSLIHI
eukprot:TRINITY_DN45879_c0_g1_i1.p1 TRINITY_DN45879_c0_g1~~TRINITY_DN45879_c0_g1_i1.p1  ORF type:complete len:177 (-),score=36.45 TRINITY_DN45879_c0_g1_i1:20-550(-)